MKKSKTKSKKPVEVPSLTIHISAWGWTRVQPTSITDYYIEANGARLQATKEVVEFLMKNGSADGYEAKLTLYPKVKP
jgi:hypothetical protein